MREHTPNPPPPPPPPFISSLIIFPTHCMRRLTINDYYSLSPFDCGTKDTARQCGNFDVSAADETLENFLPASHRLAVIVVVAIVVATVAVVVATVAVASSRP